MVINIIIIYCILMCWWCYGYYRREVSMTIYNNFQLFFHFFVVIGFFMLFVVFMRVLSLFRENKIFDLNNIELNYSFFTIILFIGFIYSLRRLIMYIFKICFFKLHWFLLSPNNLRSYKFYSNFYMNIIYAPAYHSYKYLAIINVFVTLGLFFIIFYDLLFNNFVLDYTLWYLRYYSVFKLIYVGYKFIIEKQQIVLDYYSYNLLYSGAVDESDFHLNMDPDHRFMMGESMRYGNGVVRESIKYIPATRKKLRDMQYFKQILK